MTDLANKNTESEFFDSYKLKLLKEVDSLHTFFRIYSGILALVALILREYQIISDLSLGASLGLLFASFMLKRYVKP